MKMSDATRASNFQRHWLSLRPSTAKRDESRKAILTVDWVRIGRNGFLKMLE